MFSAAAAHQPLGSFEVPAPTDEQRWWPYCVDGQTLYYADSLNGGHLYRWQPGQGAPTEVLQFSAAGIRLGILFEVSVEANRMVLLESGRLWMVDLTGGRARWLGNKKEADSGFLDSSGILFRTPDGLFFEGAQSPGAVRNLSQELRSAPSPVPDNPLGHRDDEQPAVLWRGQLIYIGWSGVYAYHLTTGVLRPLLLEHSEVEGGRIDYRNPQVTADGSLFVTGLISQSGAVGADGPLYRVNGWD